MRLVIRAEEDEVSVEAIYKHGDVEHGNKYTISHFEFKAYYGTVERVREVIIRMCDSVIQKAGLRIGCDGMRSRVNIILAGTVMIAYADESMAGSKTTITFEED